MTALDNLPVESFKDAAPYLRRPFTPAAVKFKVQATWPKDDPNGGLIVAYIDARLTVERLNLVCPDLWHDEYQPIGDGLMWCYLTVDGITRRDVGEGKGKGLVSDALKRAAVKFGVGVSLYAIPKMILNVSGGTVKQRTAGGKKTLEMTPRGEVVLRDMYANWLDAHGIASFGEPLDHGDVDGAQGDPEADASVIPANVDAATGEVIPPTRKDVKQTPGVSDVPAEDPEWDRISEQIRVPGTAPLLKSYLIDDLGVALPASLSSWKRVIQGLSPENRVKVKAWLQAREDAKADVPWSEDDGVDALKLGLGAEEVKA